MSGFVDEAQLHAKAGDGGAGAVSFRREAHVARGGPDGGDGGRGGDVWLVASTNQASLLGFRDHPFRRAADGGHGSGKRRHGARGGDLKAPVPVGTVVRDRDGAVLCDLRGPGDRWLAAEGGHGGRGNASFGGNARRAPAFAEQGEQGQERWLELELKLVADVALVGLPNAGKSTLISAVSAAKPKIADYPFTTLQPHLGVVRVPHDDDEVELVVADVPGLVEGAAEGRGLGHRFLRHVERARVLVVLVDLANLGGVAPAAQQRALLGELGRYRTELLARPRLVVGSKADAADPDALGGAPVDLAISAVSGQGLGELLRRLAEMVVTARRAEVHPAEVVVHRPVAEGLLVEREGPGRWAVTGRPALRAVGLSDMTDDGAMAEAVRRLRRLGVDRLLRRAGAHDGDEVRVGETTFTWYRDEQLEPPAASGVAGRPAPAPAGGRRVSTVVVKVGSSTVTTAQGAVDPTVVRRLGGEIAAQRGQGNRVVVVTSGAVAAGWSAMTGNTRRPDDPALLQAVAAVGQHRLMRTWDDGLGEHGLLAGQVLLAPLDFVDRRQYLHARGTLSRLLDLGVVPVVNENDAVADEEIRFGDNDRLSALVAHLVRADLLVLLTDTPGLFTADPRLVAEASLIEEVVEIDQRLEKLAGGPGTELGRGGMASKLAAAKIATWSGVTTVIADGQRPGVLAAAVRGETGAGTVCRARTRRLSARKLWIAFALGASGALVVDDGARRAVVERGRSLLAAGVVECSGGFEADDAVEIAGPDGEVFAKGLVRYGAGRAAEWIGRRSDELPDDLPPEVVHRDDLVVLV